MKTNNNGSEQSTAGTPPAPPIPLARIAGEGSVARTPASGECPGEASPHFPQHVGESDRAYEAFRVYLELGPRRRYAAVARKVGAALRTVKRWAMDFDWGGRIKTYAVESAEQYAETERAVHREVLLDAAARAKAFHERRYAVAEAIPATAERCLQHVEGDDPDQVTFADACKALEVASRIGHQAQARENDDPSASTRNLRDQLATLLEQAYAEKSSPNGVPAASNPPPPQS